MADRGLSALRNPVYTSATESMMKDPDIAATISESRNELGIADLFRDASGRDLFDASFRNKWELY
jgi:hypothetical protein